MLKVVHILDSLDMGGIESYLMDLYRNIDKERIIFDFIIFKEENCFEEEALSYGSTIYKCSTNNFVSKMQFIYKVVKENKYKIVHCHHCSLKGLLRGVIPARLCKTKIIAHSHNTGTPSNTLVDKLLREIIKFILTECSDYHFACSVNAADSKFSKTKNKRILKNGISTEAFIFNDMNRQLIRSQLNIDEETCLYGNVGRLEEQKNQSFLLKIFADVCKANNNSLLIIVGAGGKEKELVALAEKLEIQDKVLFVGMVRDIYRYLSAMDVFVFPSLYEGLGIALIEAQANGLKCVVSSSIPKEAIVTDLVIQLPLDGNISKWSEIMKHCRSKYDRKSYSNIVRDSGYDICQVAIELEQFYIGIV